MKTEKRKRFEVTLLLSIRTRLKDVAKGVQGLEKLHHRINTTDKWQTLRLTDNEIALLIKSSSKYGFQIQMMVEENLGYLIADDITTITNATPLDDTALEDSTPIEHTEAIEPKDNVQQIDGIYLVDCTYIPNSVAYEIVKKHTGKVFDYSRLTVDVYTAYTNAVYTHMDGDNIRACDKLIIGVTVQDVVNNPDKFIDNGIVTDSHGATIEPLHYSGLSTIKVLPTTAEKLGSLLPMEYINNYLAFSDTITRLIHPLVRTVKDMVSFIRNDAVTFVTIPTPDGDDYVACGMPYVLDTPTADGCWLVESKGVGFYKSKYKVQWRVKPPTPYITAFDLLHYPWYETVYSIIDANGDYLL
jgi:hypothetical protein